MYEFGGGTSALVDISLEFQKMKILALIPASAQRAWPGDTITFLEQCWWGSRSQSEGERQAAMSSFLST